MKFLSLVLILSLNLNLALANDDVLIPKADVDELAYALAVKNRIAQDPSLLGRLVLAESTLATWELSDRSRSATDSFAKSYNELERKYKEQLKLAESSKNFQIDNRPFKFAELALDALGKIPATDPNSAALIRIVGMGTPLGKELIQGVKSEIEDALGPKVQLAAQRDLLEKNQRAQKGLDNLIQRIYERSQTDADYESLTNLMISRHVGARPGESAATIFGRDPVVKNQAVVDGLNSFLRSKLGPKGELTISVKELEAHLKTVQADLKALVEAQRARLLAQKDADPVSTFLGEPRLTARDISDYKERQQTYQNYQTTVGTLAQVFRFIDPKMAEVVGKVGGAYLSVAQSIDTFATSAKGGVSFMSGVTLTGDLLGALNSVLSLFGIGGPKIEKVILDEVIELRKQVAALRQEMHGRFDRIDRSLNQIFQTMLSEFQKLTEKVDRMEADVQTTMIAMSRLGNQLEQFEKLNRKHLDAIVSRQFKDELWGCDDGKDPLLNKPLSTQKYEQCLNVYLRCAVQHSTDDLATGLVSASSEAHKVVTEVLQLGFPESWTVNERWLSTFALPEKRFTEGFVNPSLWSYCALNYVRLAASRPDMLAQLKIENTEKMMALGNLYAQSVQTQRMTAGPGLPPLFRRLIGEYQHATDALTLSVQAEKHQFRTVKAAGYDVLLPPTEAITQTPAPGHARFVPKVISICAGESLPYTTTPPVLPVNPEMLTLVRAQIPAAALLLGDLRDQEAQLTVCYRDARWVHGSCPKQVGKGESHGVRFKWRTEHQLCLAKLEVTIEARWKKHVVSSVTLTSPGEHPYTLLEHRDLYREVVERGGRDQGSSRYYPPTPDERTTTTFDNGWNPETNEPLRDGAFLASSVLKVWVESGAKFFEGRSLTQTVSPSIAEEAVQTVVTTRNNLFPYLKDKIGTLAKNANDAFKDVAVRQRLLVTFLQRVYPHEFSGNDALRATLYGNEAILGAENLGGFETVFLHAEMGAFLRARAATLEKVIAKFPANEPTGIESTQSELRRLHAVQRAQLR